MKTFLAQILKDASIHRVLLIIWGACLVVSLLRFTQPATVSQVPMVFAITMIFAMVVQFFLTALLVAQIVQTDSLIEPDAFWRTRPIPRSVLLAEKATLAALLVAGVLLTAVSVGSGNSPISPLSVITTVTAFMAFAAVTSNILQLVLAFLCLGLVPKFIAALLFVQGTISTSTYGQSFNVGIGNQSGASVGEPAWLPVLFFAGVLAVIVCQYLTLRTNVSRALLFATYLLTAILAHG